jgi:fucose 4-O-acetylase-like acetyltransferase
MFVLVLELVFYGVCMLVVRRWLILSMQWRNRDTEYDIRYMISLYWFISLLFVPCVRHDRWWCTQCNTCIPVIQSELNIFTLKKRTETSTSTWLILLKVMPITNNHIKLQRVTQMLQLERRLHISRENRKYLVMLWQRTHNPVREREKELLWGKTVTRYVGCSHTYVIHIWLRSQPHRCKSVW